MRLASLMMSLLLLAGCEMTPGQARRELVDRGYSYTRSSFAESLARGDSAGVELFLLARMDPDATTGGYSMLAHAAGEASMVARLLQAGAGPDGAGGVSTPLIEAVDRGAVRAVRLLLDAGARPDLADGTGRTPLMAAADAGDTTAAKWLLAAGADASARSSLGATPLSLARRGGHAVLVEMLLQAGAGDVDGLNLEALMDPSSLTAQAPARYQVLFETSAGTFLVEVNRAWAPRGADRFYNLVTHGFFDGQRFFRVVPGRLVQFGLHGRPEIAGRWYEATFPDDPARQRNAAGTLAFASGGGPHSRTTQVFINLTDNPGFDTTGLVPFGWIVEGFERVQQIYAGYGEQPEQATILARGDDYLQDRFPRLDSILQARRVR